MRWIWLIAVAVAFGLALWRQRFSVVDALADIEAWRIAAAAFTGLVGVGVSGQIWRSLMTGLGAPLAVGASVRIFFVGQLGKYLPGSVWPVLAQMELGRDHHVAPRTSAAAVALFLWVHLCTGAAVACVAVPLTTDIPAVVVLGAPLALALLTPFVLGRAIGIVLRLTRRPAPAQLPGAASVSAATGWALLMWLCYGLHLWLLAEGFGVGQGVLVNPLGMVGAFAAAWSLGFLFLIAPAGAGAREAVLLALLPLASGSALAVVVVSRVLLTFADGVWGSIGALSARRG